MFSDNFILQNEHPTINKLIDRELIVIDFIAGKREEGMMIVIIKSSETSIPIFLILRKEK